MCETQVALFLFCVFVPDPKQGLSFEDLALWLSPVAGGEGLMCDNTIRISTSTTRLNGSSAISRRSVRFVVAAQQGKELSDVETKLATRY